MLLLFSRMDWKSSVRISKYIFNIFLTINTLNQSSPWNDWNRQSLKTWSYRVNSPTFFLSNHKSRGQGQFDTNLCSRHRHNSCYIIQFKMEWLSIIQVLLVLFIWADSKTTYDEVCSILSQNQLIENIFGLQSRKSFRSAKLWRIWDGSNIHSSIIIINIIHRNRK